LEKRKNPQKLLAIFYILGYNISYTELIPAADV